MRIADDTAAHLPYFRRIQAFHHLSEEELGQITAFAEVVVFETGEEIITQGEVGSYFYGVIDGELEVSVTELQKDAVSLGNLHTGDMFGEAAIFLSEPRIASVTCRQPSTVLRIHRRNMLTFINRLPTAGNKILLVIVLNLLMRLKQTNQELAYARKPDIDFDVVDSLVSEFMEAI